MRKMPIEGEAVGAMTIATVGSTSATDTSGGPCLFTGFGKHLLVAASCTEGLVLIRRLA